MTKFKKESRGISESWQMHAGESWHKAGEKTKAKAQETGSEKGDRFEKNTDIKHAQKPTQN